MQKTSNILLLQFIEKLHKSNENQQKTSRKMADGYAKR